MKKYLYLVSALTLAAMTGCQNENEILGIQNDSNVVFSASIEDGNDSRTALNSGSKVVWLEGDLLSVFGGDTQNQQFILKSGENTTSGDFKLNSTSGGTEDEGSSVSSLSANVGYYPYSEDVTVTENNGSFSINAIFPAEQTYSDAGTFGNGASPMVAVTQSTLDASFKFKNVGSLIKLPLTGSATITKIKLEGTNGQKLAGSYTITASNTEVENYSHTIATTDGVSEITLNCGAGGVTLTSEETVFVFAVLPVTFGANELKITIYDNVDKKMTYTHANAFTLSRSEAGNISAIEYNGDESAIVNETNLKAALAEGGTIKLDTDITLSEKLDITKATVLDLGGNTLSMSNYFSVGEGATLTISNGTIKDDNANMAYTIFAKAGTINIESDAVIETQDCAILVSSTSTAEINIKGKITGTSTVNAPFQTNGSNGTCNATINVLEGSVIESTGCVAMYIAAAKEVNIYGGTITGTTGVEIRAGKLNITGGTITATATTFKAEANPSGYTIDGAAVAVSQHTTNVALEANISGGTFNGIYALYEEDTYDETGEISLSVTDGTFNGLVYSENCSDALTEIAKEATTTVESTVTLTNGGTLDGGSATMDMNLQNDESSVAIGISTSGGTIQNLTIKGNNERNGAEKGYRAIYIQNATENVVIDNVHISGVAYPLNTGGGIAENLTLTVKNSTLIGWTSFASFASATFTNCTFGIGTYYQSTENPAWDGTVKPYITTTFDGCTFEKGFYIDLSELVEGATVTFKNCKVGETEFSDKTEDLNWESFPEDENQTTVIFTNN